MYIGLGLDGPDILELLNIISRYPVPKIVIDSFQSSSSAKIPSLHAVAPDFVLTNTTEETAQLLVKQMGNGRFFALEIAKDVWGFFDTDLSGGESYLQRFTIAERHRDLSNLEKVIKNSGK